MQMATHQGTGVVILNQQPPQPHQQSAAPAQMTVTYHHANVSPMEGRGVSGNYKGASGRATGWVQLICGIASILLNIIQLAALHSELSVIGDGIWGGLLFLIPTGILGIVSANKNTCVIISYMVMSILSSIVGFVMINIGIISAVSPFCLYSYYGCDNRSAVIAVDSLHAIVGLVELITGIVAASICCAGMCCGKAQQQNTTVQYYTNTATPMVVSATPSMGQQQVVASYGGQPTAYTTQGAQQGYAIAPPVHYPTQPTCHVQPSYPQQQQQYQQLYAPQQQPYPPQQEPNPGAQQMPPPPEYNLVSGDYQKS